VRNGPNADKNAPCRTPGARAVAGWRAGLFIGRLKCESTMGNQEVRSAMPKPSQAALVDLNIDRPIWDRMFTVAPLIVVGTRERNGDYDLAPKHMATPLSWENYFGFVCTPSHGTYRNVEREKAFTISFPNPDQILLASLAAAPRCDDSSKPSLQALPTIRATVIDGMFLKDAYLFLECELDRIVDGFADNSLIAGRIVAARISANALRANDRDDQELLLDSPLLAYLSPGRYATIDHSFSFPFPAGMKKEAK
jgi:flavin reductase (DIM6/NTAB) family NADH-FMN oxidoreductase RutF